MSLKDITYPETIICFKWIYRWKVIRDFPVTVYNEKRFNVCELKIRKGSLFYEVFNEDAKILHYLFGYKIKDKRVSFPNNALIKVLNTLEENILHYCWRKRTCSE